MRRILTVVTAFTMAATRAATAQEDFCASPIGVSHLLTPGTATCEVMGQSTTVTLFDNTVIEWDTITLTAGQTLEFAFSNSRDTVVNQSLGTAKFPVIGVTRPTLIGGTLVSNGNVVILSPNNALQFTDDARVTAGSFTASGLGGSSGQFFAESGDIILDATPLTTPVSDIRGRITTTSGDVILVGKELEIIADIDSAGSVTAVTGTSVRLARTGRRVKGAIGNGQIVQAGVIKGGGDIAFSSQLALSLAGEVAPRNGQGKFYAKVNDNGRILIGPAGLSVRGTPEFSTMPIGEVATVDPDQGDNPGARSPAVNEFPNLGSRKSSSGPTRPTSSTITARARSGFSNPVSGPERKRKLAAGGTGSLATRSTRTRSFFGTRATISQQRR